MIDRTIQNLPAECTKAYTDYLYQMKQFGSMVAYLANRITGSSKINLPGRKLISLTWRRLTVYDGIRDMRASKPKV